MAVAGMLHTADDTSPSFSYVHLPGLRHVLLASLKQAGEAKQPQSVVCLGDWSTMLMQSVLAAVCDVVAAAPGELQWTDASGRVARLEAALHMTMVLACAGGRYCACGIVPWLGRDGCGLDVAWLWPRFLTTLSAEGEMECVLQLPIYQHLLSAPRAVLVDLLPPSLLPAEDSPARWQELVGMLEGMEATRDQVSAFTRALAAVVVLLDRPAAERESQQHDAALSRHCGRPLAELRTALRQIRRRDGPQGLSLAADRLYLRCVDWVQRASSQGGRRLRPLAIWPLSAPAPAAAAPAPASVRIVVLPQTVPSFVRPALPPCLGPYVFLANVAAEHLSVFAARTLLPDSVKHASERVIDVLHGADDHNKLLEAVLACDVPAVRRRLPAAGSPVAVSATAEGLPVLSVMHTHRAVHYPLHAVSGHAEVASGFLSALAGLLKPVLASTPLFLQHLPLYATGSPLRPHAPLLPDAHAQIRASVLLPAARALYTARRSQRTRGGYSDQQRREDAADSSQLYGSSVRGTPARDAPPKQTQSSVATQLAELRVQQQELQRRLEDHVRRSGAASPTRGGSASGDSGGTHQTAARSRSRSAATAVQPDAEDPFAARLGDVVTLTKSYRLRRESALRPAARPPSIGDVPQPASTPRPTVSRRHPHAPRPTRRSSTPAPPARAPTPQKQRNLGRPPLAPLPQQLQQQRPEPKCGPEPSRRPAPAFSEQQWDMMLADFE
eukprot:TRINITY_DN13985_c0_g1_i1.p1 TRINITY_DN13985_c0_g1~~TRINITY_DN13985_c0_g1_i1.p1  ORF type:complete len:777 (+),score=276.53 TRINITY_DN13985_c0_g1_i1:155-2332(+)